MEELLVPGIIFAVLGVIVVAGLLLTRNYKPWEAWEAVAAEWGFEFDQGGSSVGNMEIQGVTEDGIPVKIEINTLGSGEGKQYKTDLWITLPTEIPMALKIEKAVSGFAALQRAKETNPHDPALSRIWKIEGIDGVSRSRIEDDNACNQRLTNLYMAYPHTKIADGELHIDKLGVIEKQLSNTVKLCVYLARDLARVSR